MLATKNSLSSDEVVCLQKIYSNGPEKIDWGSMGKP